jgi:hypothetical protein
MATPLPCPKVGERIYVPTSMYIDHGEDDVLGGLATVTTVRLDPGHGKTFISVAEHPEHAYNWEYLGPRQAALREEFSDRLAREDPDYGPGSQGL